jgi:hypothetical protein
MKFGEFVLNKTFVREDFLTQDKYLAFAEQNRDWIQYVKTDSLFYSFPWRNGQHVPQYTPQKPIVISGHSDFAIKQEYLSKILQEPVKVWFGINTDCEDPNVYTLPHGLTNDCNDSERHPILGNQDIFCEVLSSEKVPKHLVYMNFNVTTDKRTPNPVRQHLWTTFSELPFVYKRECTDANINLVDRKQYLQDLYDSQFVLCPQGNGIDTVRLWESLYCRAIPIVQRHRALRQFEDLPILWIDKWEEVRNKEFLESEYDRIMNSDWNLEKLKIMYWTNLIDQVYKERILNAKK